MFKGLLVRKSTFSIKRSEDHMGTYDNAYDDYQVAKGGGVRFYLTLGGLDVYATGARLLHEVCPSKWSASTCCHGSRCN